MDDLIWFGRRPFWVDKEGNDYKASNVSDIHLLNIILFISRQILFAGHGKGNSDGIRKMLTKKKQIEKEALKRGLIKEVN